MSGSVDPYERCSQELERQELRSLICTLVRVVCASAISTQTMHGSPLVAWQEAVDGGVPFTQVHVADSNPRLLEAVDARLKSIHAPVFAETGLAEETVDRVISKLDPHALHFAFLDPYNLAALPFEVIRKLSALKRMDIVIYISIQDLQRNLQRYIDKQNSPLRHICPRLAHACRYISSSRVDSSKIP